MDETDERHQASEEAANGDRHAATRRADIEAQIRSLYRDRITWTLPLGRWAIRRPLASGYLFWAFVALHMSAATAGAVMILVGHGRLPDLGIALVVGALFGAGAFMAEVWVQSIHREQTFMAELFGDRERRLLNELVDRLDRLEDVDTDDKGSDAGRRQLSLGIDHER